MVIPAKRDKLDKRFGFASTVNVREPERFAIKLDNIIIGSEKLMVNIPRFSRNDQDKAKPHPHRRPLNFRPLTEQSKQQHQPPLSHVADMTETSFSSKANQNQAPPLSLRPTDPNGNNIHHLHQKTHGSNPKPPTLIKSPHEQKGKAPQTDQHLSYKPPLKPKRP